MTSTRHLVLAALALSLTSIPIVIAADRDQTMDKTQEALQALREKRIFFGHQSVGGEIISEIENLSRQTGNPLNVVALGGKTPPNTRAGFYHDLIGANGNPESKNSAFFKIMNERLGNMDIAFFKYCYVDFEEKTDPDKVFEQYKTLMSEMKRRHPKTTFVHVTDPLTTIQTGPRAWAKKLLGKPLGGYEANRKRNEFNERMKKQYAGKEPLFDIAALESQLPGGDFETFELDGKTYLAMAPLYTYDGGHLNDTGKRRIADALVRYLSTLAK